eukprot:g1734.t1
MSPGLVCLLFALALCVTYIEAECGSYDGVECTRNSLLCNDEDLPCACLGTNNKGAMVSACKSEEPSRTEFTIMRILAAVGVVALIILIVQCIRHLFHSGQRFLFQDSDVKMPLKTVG